MTRRVKPGLDRPRRRRKSRRSRQRRLSNGLQAGVVVDQDGDEVSVVLDDEVTSRRSDASHDIWGHFPDSPIRAADENGQVGWTGLTVPGDPPSDIADDSNSDAGVQGVWRFGPANELEVGEGRYSEDAGKKKKTVKARLGKWWRDFKCKNLRDQFEEGEDWFCELEKDEDGEEVLVDPDTDFQYHRVDLWEHAHPEDYNIQGKQGVYSQLDKHKHQKLATLEGGDVESTEEPTTEDSVFQPPSEDPSGKDDPDDDGGSLRICQETVHSFEYCDTFFELSGSRGFGWLHYYRGADPTMILFMNICGGYLLHFLNETVRRIDLGKQRGYLKLGNFLWWKGLEVSSKLMIVQSIGIIPAILDPWSCRIYYFALFYAMCGLTLAYLSINGCIGWCFWLLWMTFLGTLYSAASSAIYRLMGWRISDTLFFLYLLILILQAICTEDLEMQKAIVLLGTAVGYAGPLGTWSGLHVRIRVVIMTIALVNAIPTIAARISHQLPPDVPIPEYYNLTYPTIGQLQHLPVPECRSRQELKTDRNEDHSKLRTKIQIKKKCDSSCDLIACFDEIWLLFAGDLFPSAACKERQAKDDSGGILWILLLFLLFCIFFLCLPDKPMRRKCRRCRRHCTTANKSRKKDGAMKGGKKKRKKKCFRQSPPNIMDPIDCEKLCGRARK